MAAKRPIALLIALIVAGSLASASPAGAITAKGACLISGTMTFSAGQWRISPGVIDCRGFGYSWERIAGRGSFTGSGTYTAVEGAENCLPHLGPGTVDYWISTSERDVHLVEAPVFSPAGVGVFTTPSLRGTFHITHYDGNCVTKPDAGALFLAEVTLLRGPTRN